MGKGFETERFMKWEDMPKFEWKPRNLLPWWKRPMFAFRSWLHARRSHDGESEMGEGQR